jgi:ABC-2 type transport system ATP-binding protein
MTPYRAVSRSRTVRRGSRERRGGRFVSTFLIASRGPGPLPGCPARPNSEITATVGPVLAPLPYNQLMDTTIEVSGLRKRFGPTVALDGMSFTVAPGLLTGFVGPNGAGKSTTMRVILGLDAPDAGSALIGGRPYQSLRHPMRYVGSLIDAGALQPSRSGRNHLLWLAHSQGLAAKRVDEVIGQAGLEKAARRKAGGYSLGMRQRLGIAAAMLGDPPVIMLDEPFNGLDPEGIVWMRGFLTALARQGRAVLVSSHLMSELEDTADHLVVAGRGRVIADISMAGLIAAASGDRVRLRTTALPKALMVLEDAGATVTAGGADTLMVTGLGAERTVEVLTATAVPFSEVSAHRATLEEAYMDLTRDAVEYRAEAPGTRAAHEAGR